MGPGKETGWTGLGVVLCWAAFRGVKRTAGDEIGTLVAEDGESIRGWIRTCWRQWPFARSALGREEELNCQYESGYGDGGADIGEVSPLRSRWAHDSRPRRSARSSVPHISRSSWSSGSDGPRD